MTFIKDWFRHEDNKTGCRFIVVDAYNEERVLKYYDKNGFLPLYSYNPSNSETSLQKNTWTAGYYYNYTAELKMEDINTDPNAKPIKFDVTVDKWKDTTPGDDLNLTDKKN